MGFAVVQIGTGTARPGRPEHERNPSRACPRQLADDSADSLLLQDIFRASHRLPKAGEKLFNGIAFPFPDS
jgi:hypothetical protein